MPNRYPDMEAKLGGNSWKQNKKTGNLLRGDKMAHILAHMSPIAKPSIYIDAQQVCKHEGKVWWQFTKTKQKNGTCGPRGQKAHILAQN
jgi:hypothetical protein